MTHRFRIFNTEIREILEWLKDNGGNEWSWQGAMYRSIIEIRTDELATMFKLVWSEQLL